MRMTYIQDLKEILKAKLYKNNLPLNQTSHGLEVSFGCIADERIPVQLKNR
jgi:hypothetical protein